MLFYVCLSVVVLAFIGLGVLIRAAFSAPYAVEDDHGFQLMGAAEDRSVPALVPVQVSTPDLAFFHH